MADRIRWQYCQIEVSASSNTGLLKQFFADRAPVESDLHQNWPGMLAKLGEQGWEVVNVVAHEGGLGRRGLTYVLKRPLAGGGGGGAGISSAPPAPPEPDTPSGLGEFEPLRKT